LSNYLMTVGRRKKQTRLILEYELSLLGNTYPSMLDFSTRIQINRVRKKKKN